MNIYVSLVVNVMHIIRIQNARSLMHEPPVVYSLAIRLRTKFLILKMVLY